MAQAQGRQSPAAWVAVACVLVVALLAQQVLGAGPLVRIDLQVTHWLVAQRQPWLTDAMLALSELHRTAGVLGATALVAGWLLWRQRRSEALGLLVVPTGMLLNVGLKHVFQRARPVLDEPLVQLATYSFPSGHAVASTVLYAALATLALARLRRPAARVAACGLAAAMVLLVCFSRVYLGAHFLSDVVAGVAVGTAWTLAARRWLR